jgi:hypothetical protein
MWNAWKGKEYSVLMRESEGNKPFGRSKSKWVDNIEMVL